MIHVQIASDITTTGVEGVRWVLLESSAVEPPAMAAPAAEPVPPQALAAVPPASSGRRVELWQLAITGLGLLVALGVSQRQLGLPKLPWLATPAALAAPTTPDLSSPFAALPSTTASTAPAETAETVAPVPSEAAWVIIVPASGDARLLADPPAADSAMSSQPEPAASAALPERLTTAGMR